MINKPFFLPTRSAYVSVEAEPVHLFSMAKAKLDFDIPSMKGWSLLPRKKQRAQKNYRAQSFLLLLAGKKKRG